MAKRKALSRRTRFEIFKRDGYRCVYCGATPIQSPLHVDHVVALANGGTDDPANLVTACADCNLGKNSVPLEHKALARKAGTLEEAQDQLDQIRAYLEVQRQIEAVRQDAAREFADYWTERIGGMSQQMFDRLPKLMREWPRERLAEAVEITARRLGTPGEEYSPRDAINQQKYFHAILRNWRENGHPSEGA